MFNNELAGFFAPPPPPTSLTSSLQLQLDASDATTITESGGLVSEWRDKSGSNNHFTQVTASKQPTTNSFTVNGLNSIDFPAGKGMISSFTPNATKYTIIVVEKTKSTAAHRTISASTPNSMISGGRVGIGAYVNGYISSASATFQANRLRLEAPAGGNFRYFINDTDSTTHSRATYPWGTMTLAAGGFYAESGIVEICEILVYNRILSAGEIASVNSYLDSKWGITP